MLQSALPEYEYSIKQIIHRLTNKKLVLRIDLKEDGDTTVVVVLLLLLPSSLLLPLSPVLLLLLLYIS